MILACAMCSRTNAGHVENKKSALHDLLNFWEILINIHKQTSSEKMYSKMSSFRSGLKVFTISNTMFLSYDPPVSLQSQSTYTQCWQHYLEPLRLRWAALGDREREWDRDLQRNILYETKFYVNSTFTFSLYVYMLNVIKLKPFKISKQITIN